MTTCVMRFVTDGLVFQLNPRLREARPLWVICNIVAGSGDVDEHDRRHHTIDLGTWVPNPQPPAASGRPATAFRGAVAAREVGNRGHCRVGRSVDRAAAVRRDRRGRRAGETRPPGPAAVLRARPQVREADALSVGIAAWSASTLHTVEVDEAITCLRRR